MKKEIRLLVVDDHQIILDGITSLLSDQEDIRVVGSAKNGREALDILKVLTVDVLLMDIDMPVMNGLDAATEIKKMHTSPKIIILSMHMQGGMIRSLIDKGIDGYLIKNSGKEETVKAIRDVMSGKKVFSPDVTMTLSKKETEEYSDHPDIDLTDREVEILKLIAEGYSNKEIGEKLFISHRTVDTHRTNMMKKLEVNNIAGLIRFAIRNKIV
jgi:DNA-binding NarL/FixJ family response regulator